MPLKAQAPTVLWKEDPRRGRLVVACCPTAQSLGVRIGMPIAQAVEMCAARLSEKSSTTRLAESYRLSQPHDIRLDQETLQQIACSFQQQISPLVAVEALDDRPWAGHSRHQSESLLCDITGIAHLFDGEAGLLAAADQLLAALGISGAMAIADCVGTAWALSHHLPTGQNSFIAPTGTTREVIESLPIESLRIWPDTAATLSRLGIEYVGQLLRLPRGGLATRLGHPLVRRIEQALGEVDEPLGVYHAPAEHVAVMTLEYPTSDQRILADRIERLTKKIRAGLATCQRGALRMACRLDLAAHPPLTLEIGLFAPTIDAGHLTGLMVNQLETKKLPASVQRLTLCVPLSGPLRNTQACLFDTFSSDAKHAGDCLSGPAISRLIDSLSGRLGRDCVVGVEIEDDPLPEQAFRVSPLAGNSTPLKKQPYGKSVSSTSVRPKRSTKSSSRSSSRSNSLIQHSRRQHFADTVDSSTSSESYEPSPDDAMRRPLSLFSEPIPIAVAADHGPFSLSVSSPSLPSRIRLGGKVHCIAHYWGPERIETGWWQGPSIRRDYYRIETDSGRWWWIFRNLISKTQVSNNASRYRWMLHGQFA